MSRRRSSSAEERIARRIAACQVTDSVGEAARTSGRSVARISAKAKPPPHLPSADGVKFPVASYNTSDFKKGLKVQIDGEPYVMVEMNFVKPGKGNALYKCRMRNLVRGTILDRTYKGGDALESADVEQTDVQYLYRQGEDYVFMDSQTFEQYEVKSEVAGDAWKFLKDGMTCSVTLFNGMPIILEPPTHVELEVIDTQPGAKGDTATNVTKAAKVETGAEFTVPGFIKNGNVIKIDTRIGEYVERVSN
ncbi:MAG: elongation factor P [Planctomycetaceae bacterium]|nr:MAG: elongation factor P [Planctomycetaceae bacterium]